MKQVVQDIKNGKISLIDLPVPKASEKQVVISSSYSLISSGTEKMLINFGKSNWINKVKSQPDKVKQVISKIKNDGIAPTIESVKNKLNTPMPLGYSNVGKVIDIINNDKFKLGDRVVSNGYHAEAIKVSEQLCVKIPDNVSDKEATFSIIGSIALQGIRLIAPTIGEKVAVIGLGIVGQLAVQLLRANGCHVTALDYNSKRVEVAAISGAKVIDLSKIDNADQISSNYNEGHGLDAVVIATDTKSEEPINLSTKLCRKRGRIVLIGQSGTNIPRDGFYAKEISFQVSCSYGPGRYDRDYEVHGIDYPLPYVRWTERRNIEAVLELLSNKKIIVEPLISNIFKIEDVDKAYSFLTSNDSEYLAMLFEYSKKNADSLSDTIYLNKSRKKLIDQSDKITVSFIGAGNFASKTLMPSFQKAGCKFNYLLSDTGIKNDSLGKKFKFNSLTSNPDELYKNVSDQIVVVAANHKTHANYVIELIKSGKNVYVEKPLCINKIQLKNLKNFFESINSNGQSPKLMIGYNRRFSKISIKLKKLLSERRQPKFLVYDINAGSLENETWIQDRKIGGGRVVGEVCHFVDLVIFFMQSEVIEYKFCYMDSKNRDSLSISLSFKDGSIAIINYFANGSNFLPKEELKVHCNGCSFKIDNFKSLKAYNVKNFSQMKLFYQDKGHETCVKSFVDSVKNHKLSPISISEIIKVSELTIRISNST